MPTVKLLSLKGEPTASPLETFVACAHQMLDSATAEHVRRDMEPRLLAQLPMLRALGVFELFELRDPALRAWLADELAVVIPCNDVKQMSKAARIGRPE